MGAHPTGVVTFLFTDIEGSTRLWERHPHDMRDALVMHDGILRNGFERHDGYVFGVLGDGFAAAFAAPIDAITSAIEIQSTLRATAWPHGEEMRVRIAIDTGIADERDDEYYGSALNRLGRVIKLIDGGTSVITSTTASIVRDELDGGIELNTHTTVQVRDMDEPVEILEISVGGEQSPPGARPQRSFHALLGEVERLVDDAVGHGEADG